MILSEAGHSVPNSFKAMFWILVFHLLLPLLLLLAYPLASYSPRQRRYWKEVWTYLWPPLPPGCLQAGPGAGGLWPPGQSLPGPSRPAGRATSYGGSLTGLNYSTWTQIEKLIVCGALRGECGHGLKGCKHGGLVWKLENW